MRRSLLAALLALAPAQSLAQGTYNGLALCFATGNQTATSSVSDGAGGAIVTWEDSRAGDHDIYAQHVLTSGMVDPAWPAGGRALCIASYEQQLPTIVADGSGGAIVAWGDTRNGTDWNVYAQHVLASGAVDPAWPPSGRALCTAASTQQFPAIASDGAGGAIVTWQDYRSLTDWNIYAQHVLASGSLDPAWALDGEVLCAAASTQQSPSIIADGAGGAIVAWQDYRTLAGWGVYAQHMLASGVTDPSWPLDGRAVCAISDVYTAPKLVPDGVGGAIVTWDDYRSASSDIYAQHLLPSGTIDPLWPANGRALCTAAYEQSYPTIVADGSGGAIIAWIDFRNQNSDVYAQHVQAGGSVDPGWPLDGRALCAAGSSQQFPKMIPDGAGGAIVTWEDSRTVTNWDIYAQHVLASGAVAPAWPADGRALCTAVKDQSSPSIVADGAGGAIVAWQDNRNGTDYNVYAQRVSTEGNPLFLAPDPDCPQIVGIQDVPNDQGGRVSIAWQRSASDVPGHQTIVGYRVWRRIPGFVSSQDEQARGTSESAVEPTMTMRMVSSDRGVATITYWEAIATLPAERLSGYGFTASTPQDSMAGSNPYTAFFVTALTSDAFMFFQSFVDSGYSVDNLSPPQPVPFAVVYSGAGNALHWTRGRAPDLREFRLYRGGSSSFVPSQGNLVAATRETSFVDIPGAYHYKLGAVDVHGNASRYAQVSPDLPTAALASLVNTEVLRDQIRLTWFAGGRSGTDATVQRRTVVTDWEDLGRVAIDGQGYLTYVDHAVQPGMHYAYRLAMEDAGDVVFTGETWLVADDPQFALMGARPNPVVGGAVSVEFVLATGGRATLEMFDVGGRRVATADVSSLGVGRHVVSFAPRRSMAPGVYLLRLGQDQNVVTSRVVVVD